jgi:hypothetical protein
MARRFREGRAEKKSWAASSAASMEAKGDEKWETLISAVSGL